MENIQTTPEQTPIQKSWKAFLPLIIGAGAIIALIAGLVAYNSSVKNFPNAAINSISKAAGMSAGDLVGKQAVFKKALIKKTGDKDVAFWIYDSKGDFQADKSILVFLNFYLEQKAHRDNNIEPLRDGQQVTIKGVFKKTPLPEEINKFWSVSPRDSEVAGRKGVYLEAESFELIK